MTVHLKNWFLLNDHLRWTFDVHPKYSFRILIGTFSKLNNIIQFLFPCAIKISYVHDLSAHQSVLNIQRYELSLSSLRPCRNKLLNPTLKPSTRKFNLCLKRLWGHREEIYPTSELWYVRLTNKKKEDNFSWNYYSWLTFSSKMNMSKYSANKITMYEEWKNTTISKLRH